jgi:hypothetical protein
MYVILHMMSYTTSYTTMSASQFVPFIVISYSISHTTSHMISLATSYNNKAYNVVYNIVYDVVYDVVSVLLSTYLLFDIQCRIRYIVCDIVYDIVYDIVCIPHHASMAANQPDLVSGTKSCSAHVSQHFCWSFPSSAHWLVPLIVLWKHVNTPHPLPYPKRQCGSVQGHSCAQTTPVTPCQPIQAKMLVERPMQATTTPGFRGYVQPLHVQHPSSSPLGSSEKLSCCSNIGTVRLSDRPISGLHSWLVQRQCLWTATTALF